MEFRFISHKDADELLIEKIIILKNHLWQYPLEAHRKWMLENITNDDIHLLLQENDICVGYLNLVKLHTNIPGFQDKAWGIGNVCVHPNYQGLSYGHLLISLTNHFLFKEKSIGILICRDKLVKFYEKCGWHRFAGSCKLTNDEFILHNIFTSSEIPATSQLVIDRNF